MEGLGLRFKMESMSDQIFLDEDSTYLLNWIKKNKVDHRVRDIKNAPNVVFVVRFNEDDTYKSEEILCDVNGRPSMDLITFMKMWEKHADNPNHEDYKSDEGMLEMVEYIYEFWKIKPFTIEGKPLSNWNKKYTSIYN